MTTVSTDRGSITANVPLQIQETLETAAGMIGTTVSQFIIQIALREAERIIESERVIRLSAEDSKAFLDALDNPPVPNDKLMTVLQNHAAQYNDQTGTLNWTPRAKRI